MVPENITTSIGQPVRRIEDIRFLTGQGLYTTDVILPDQAHAVFLRSPYPAARIEDIDTSAAKSSSGVCLVLTAKELADAGLGNIPCYANMPGLVDLPFENSDGTEKKITPIPLLVSKQARFVGDPVAAVIAETYAAALDAVEKIRVTWVPRAAVTETQEALLSKSPQVWKHIPENLAADVCYGDEEACEAEFKKAAYIVSLRTAVQRVTGAMPETRAAVADYDQSANRITLYCGGDNSVRLKRDIANALGFVEEQVRVISGDIGGNYGTRNWTYPEYAVTAYAAKALQRPVRWQATRSEALLSDYHGRDNYADAKLALDANGKFLALQAAITTNIGAYTVAFVPLMKTTELLPSVYNIATAAIRGRAAISNTSPTAPYRSAGRPEAMFIIERLIEIAATSIGFDPLTLRRKNLIDSKQMPYRTALGLEYDNGNFEEAMNRALALGEWKTFPERRIQSEQTGKLRGIGFANYIEITSGFPFEQTTIRVHSDNRVSVIIGTTSSGQGHETSFAQCVSDWLNVPFETVEIITGDTDIVAEGGGSHSARSMRMAGIVMGRATQEIIAKGRKIAAYILEAPETDIDFISGSFIIRGTDRSLNLFQTAHEAETGQNIPKPLAGPLEAMSSELMQKPGFPYGAQVCEVEVDRETGKVDVVKYTSVDDVGRAINPMILHGQTHGGIVQGAGQALLENLHYDKENGQMLSSSFMDYALSRADDFPTFNTEIMEIPSNTNPLGIRGGGEGGTTPALAVVINAIVNALEPFGIKHVEMPATPQRIWEALNDSGGSFFTVEKNDLPQL